MSSMTIQALLPSLCADEAKLKTGELYLFIPRNAVVRSMRACWVSMEDTIARVFVWRVWPAIWSISVMVKCCRAPIAIVATPPPPRFAIISTIWPSTRCVATDYPSSTILFLFRYWRRSDKVFKIHWLRLHFLECDLFLWAEKLIFIVRFANFVSECNLKRNLTT